MLAENLKNARKKAGLTQMEMALKLGVSRASLSSWEIARTNPDLATFIRICQELGMSADDLLGLVREEEYAHLKQPVVELADLISRLSPAEFNMVRKVVVSIINEKKKLKK